MLFSALRLRINMASLNLRLTIYLLFFQLCADIRDSSCGSHVCAFDAR